MEVDAIVNAANPALSHVGGVAKAISIGAGGEMQRECTERVRRRGELKVGQTILDSIAIS